MILKQHICDRCGFIRENSSKVVQFWAISIPVMIPKVGRIGPPTRHLCEPCKRGFDKFMDAHKLTEAEFRAKWGSR